MSHGEESEHANARRAEIIAVARELYEERGIAQTTIMDITARMGVTRTLFYHYFPDKESVTSAVLDDYVDDFVEALHHWNAQRKPGHVDDALTSVVKLLRMAIFEKGAFREALASHENASLYIEFVSRAADHAATYIIDTTVADYAQVHNIEISHLYETFYVLITGIVSYVRRHPEADDAVIADLIAQTLRIEAYRDEVARR